MKDKNSIVLLFDLDDTLVKNSEYFVQVKENVAEEIAKYDPRLCISAIIQAFDTREKNNAQNSRGWGIENFRISLLEESHAILGYTFFQHQLYEYIDHQVAHLKNRHVELLVGVKETVRKLNDKGYRMFIITKGRREELAGKIDHSEIKDYFDEIEVIDDKTPEAYARIIDKYNLAVESCFMIGNSPKSDINPAKSIGLRTIFIPNGRTWNFEHEEISDEQPATIELDSFSELATLAFEDILSG